MSTSTYDNRMSAQTMPNATTVDTATLVGGGAHTHRRISWAAIFGGVILVVAIQLLLSLLGAGIGLGTIDTNAGSTPNASSLGIGAGVWWVVSSCIALLVGGYVSAWLAGIELRFDGVLHGLITWSIATLLTFWLLTSAIGGIIGGGFSALGSVASAAGSGVSEAAKPLAQAAGVSPDMVQQQSASLPATGQSGPGGDDPAKCPERSGIESGYLRQGWRRCSGSQGAGHQHCRRSEKDQPRRCRQAVRRCSGEAEADP